MSSSQPNLDCRCSISGGCTLATALCNMYAPLFKFPHAASLRTLLYYFGHHPPCISLWVSKTQLSLAITSTSSIYSTSLNIHVILKEYQIPFRSKIFVVKSQLYLTALNLEYGGRFYRHALTNEILEAQKC